MEEISLTSEIKAAVCITRVNGSKYDSQVGHRRNESMGKTQYDAGQHNGSGGAGGCP